MSDTLSGKHRSDPEDAAVDQSPDSTSDDLDPLQPAAPPPVDPPQVERSRDLPTDATQPIPASGPAEREVTCPECGTVSRIAMNRRESHDFCPRCDFPLFWTKSEVLLDSGGPAGGALRRLPGTAGRITVGSLACPHCSEANPVTGATCLRCGGDLHPKVAPPPRVEAPPPAPAPVEPPPEPTKTPLWVWITVGATVVVLFALVAYLLLR